MEARTHEFEFEGKKFKFREMMVEELDAYVFPDAETLSDLNKQKPFIISQAKLLTKLSLDKIDFSKWRPFEFLEFIKQSTKFIMCELLGVKPGELKMDLTQIPMPTLQK